MKYVSRGIFFLVGTLLIWNTCVQGAQKLEDWTLEEVLAGIAEANGGMESIESVTNARFIGNVEGSENSYDFMILKRRPNLMRSRMKMRKKVVETGYDGSLVWQRFEQDDYDKVVQVEDPKVIRNVEYEADFDGPLIGDLAPGLVRRLAGVERLDRVDYFVIEILSEDASSLHYVDSRTFRELRVVKTIQTGNGDSMVINTTFHEVEKHSGIWVARRVEKELSNGVRETIRINKIEMNPGILDFPFKMPQERNPVPGS